MIFFSPHSDRKRPSILLLIFFVTAGCQGSGNDRPAIDSTVPSETPSATEISFKPGGSEATIDSQPTAILPTPTKDYQEVDPIIVDVEPLNGPTYVSDGGNFRITYSEQAEIYENEVPSVDGVLVPVENTIAIRSREGYVLVVTHFDLEVGSPLSDFVAAQSQCVSVTPATGQSYHINSQEFLFFIDTPCGPAGASFFYTIQGSKGYLFQVITPYRYATVKDYIEPILTSFQTLE